MCLDLMECNNNVDDNDDNDENCVGSSSEEMEDSCCPNEQTPNDNDILLPLSSSSSKRQGEEGRQQQQRQRRRRKLFSHQARAIESIFNHRRHTIVCTGTGSGKSLCYLLPILACSMNSTTTTTTTGKKEKKGEGMMNHHNHSGVVHYNDNDNDDDYSSSCSKSIVIYPTKALAQDQFQKIQSVLHQLEMELRDHHYSTSSSSSYNHHHHEDINNNDENDDDDENVSQQHYHQYHYHLPRVGVIDGDVPIHNRSSIVSNCDVLLTNPDTLHACLLPNWKSNFRQFLGAVDHVVLDEAHIYRGNHHIINDKLSLVSGINVMQLLRG